jgi:4-hydroxy-3-methylbut-2-enyl diphosphate reductase
MDKMKKDFSPTLLDFGPVRMFLARHFGFCYGVENAIEIAFRTVEENPDKRIFLLSEMIHNPQVNADLEAHGIRFLQDTYGRQLIPFDELSSNDIVLIPAFGTTPEIEKKLNDLGIATDKHDTTCPFVEKVWNRSEAIARNNYTIVIHGKPNHEETRATFSRAVLNGPAVIVRDIGQAESLAAYIRGEKKAEQFEEEFGGQCSPGLNGEKDLQRIGVVNQTTMLASDTQAIADLLRQAMSLRYGNEPVEEHFADTRDTLCYATNDNQSAVLGMLETKADLAIIVGGYNSSNTSHLVELCEQRIPTYFISNEDKILSRRDILHYDFHTRQEILTSNYLPHHEPASILITSGASCPDAIVEGVISKITGYFPSAKPLTEIIDQFR